MYSKGYFKNQRAGSRTSAQNVVPLILSLVSPKSVVDVGCGTGAWLSEFRKQGINDFLGIDGDYMNRDLLLIPKENYRPADIMRPIKLKRQYDIATCLEVAEHLPENFAKGLVKSLTKLAPVIIFSAAIPHQGGNHHLNEQWPNYWEILFKRHGYIAIDALRPKIWNNKNIEWWYKQNMLVFVKENSLKKYPKLENEKKLNRKALSLIHPDHYMELKNSFAFKIHSTITNVASNLANMLKSF